MSFGQRLKGLRRDLDLSQAEIADRAGCSVNTIRKLESDERRPSRELAARLSDVFELSPRDRAEFLRQARGTPSLTRPTLPVPMTRLIGREQDVAAVKELLLGADARLLSLVGPPGVGKTRLALQVATELQEVFRDGAAFVLLAAVREPTLVEETIAQTLGVRGASTRPIEQALVEHLHTRQLLLVLDNFEQLLAARERVGNLLVSAPRLKVLVTSREPLATYGEYVFSVPTLGLPEVGSRHVQARAAQRSPAERLFLERARAVRPNFASDQFDQPVIANICRRLEGLPLAIELAASRAKSMTPRTLLEHLGQHLDVLSAGPTDFSPRQRSMRGALDWSYELLDPDERRLFSQMSVFAGGATVDAIAAVCGASGGAEAMVAQLVESLVDKSLLRIREVAGGTRLVMLETIRQYALERLLALDGPGKEYELRERHAAHFTTAAERASDELTRPDQIAWLQRLDADHHNLRAALNWALGHEDAERAGRLCAALWPFWHRRGHYHEGRRFLSAALALSSPMPARYRAAVLNGAGVLAIVQRDHALAEAFLGESRDLYTSLGDASGVAFAISNLGWLAHDSDEATRALALFEESLRLRRELGEQNGEATCLNNLGMMALERPDLQAARELFTQSAELYRRTGHTSGLAQALSNLGWAFQDLGEYPRATDLFTESLDLARQLEWAFGIAMNISNLALMALYRGDYATAYELFGDSLSAFVELGDKRGVAEGLEGLAGVAGVQGRAEEAARLFGSAEALRESIRAPLLQADRSRYESMVAAAREQLADEAWTRAWLAGRLTRVDEMLAGLLE